MANEANKKQLVRNASYLKNLMYQIILCNTIYALYRIWFLWESFSSWHIVAEVVMLMMYVLMYRFLASEASPKHAPLSQGGALLYAGRDLAEKGVMEYTWDLLYVTMFVQITTCFLSDLFFLVSFVPPTIGFYYAWTMYIYPWISKPDAPPQGMQEIAGKKQKVKNGRGR